MFIAYQKATVYGFLLELYYDLTKDIDLDETNTRAFVGRALVPEVRKAIMMLVPVIVEIIGGRCNYTS
jgi:hypothetical protein